MEVRILLIGRYFTLAGPAKPIRVARPKAVDLASINYDPKSLVWRNKRSGEGRNRTCLDPLAGPTTVLKTAGTTRNPSLPTRILTSPDRG